MYAVRLHFVSVDDHSQHCFKNIYCNELFSAKIWRYMIIIPASVPLQFRGCKLLFPSLGWNEEIEFIFFLKCFGNINK